MMKFVSVFVMLALMVSVGVVQAQTPVPSPTPATLKLQVDAVPTGEVRTFYRLYELPTSGAPVLLTDNIPVATSGPTQFAFPALTPGVHQLVARSVLNSAGALTESGNSNSLSIRMVVLTAPSGMSIIVAEFRPDIGWMPMLKAVQG